MKYLACTSSVAFFLAACSSGSGGGGGGGGGGSSGTLSIEATDAPLAYDYVSAATISVDSIAVHHDPTATTDFTTVYQGAPITFDLAQLRNGHCQSLSEALVSTGVYRQIRFRVTGAELVLVNGHRFSTEDGDLELVGQEPDGYRVAVHPGLAVLDGQTTRALLDFDMTRTYETVPWSADPLTATAFTMEPHVRVADLATTGAILGVVVMVASDPGDAPASQELSSSARPIALAPRAAIPESTGDGGDGGEGGDGSVSVTPLTGNHDRVRPNRAGTVPAAGCTVYVLHAGEVDLTQRVAVTVTGGAGGFAVLGLDPGTYDVVAIVRALTGVVRGRVDGVVVAPGQIAFADITID